jgi:hypothetical protein
MNLPEFVDMILKSERPDENWINQFDSINLSEIEVETIASMRNKVQEYINLKSIDKNHPMNTILNHIILILLQVERASLCIQSDKEEYVLNSPAVVMLIPEDYPRMFRGLTNKSKLFAHPEDYRLDNKPIKPSLFLYKPDTRIRLFLRISLKVSQEDRFTAATFLLDTGCCPHLNISSLLKNHIRSRIKKNDTGADFLVTEINGETVNCIVKEDLPEVRKPANVMGLPMFFLLGLSFTQNRLATFTYDEDDVAHDVGKICNVAYL